MSVPDSNTCDNHDHTHHKVIEVLHYLLYGTSDRTKEIKYTNFTDENPGTLRI